MKPSSSLELTRGDVELAPLRAASRGTDVGSAVAEARDLSLAFGGNRVLNCVEFGVKPGSAVLLRGANGSGKTTLLNVLSGFVRPQTGVLTLRLHGRQLVPWETSPERLARFGLGRLWQDIRLFPSLSVLDNVLAATPHLAGTNPILAVAAVPIVLRQERIARERALHNLTLTGMVDRAHSSADKLSVGQMKRVAIARMLQTGPELLLLDEPLAGLDHAAAESLVDLLARLRLESHLTLVIVEHRDSLITPICNEFWQLADGTLRQGLHSK
jgi:ABC-type branched-subunit amino acid transport system ATPase component